MKVKLRRWLHRLRPANSTDREEDLPLHLELFNLDQLQRHAESLANKHDVGPRRGPDRLLPRLANNEIVLVKAYEQISAAAQKKQPISPAGEWLLDNFHLIEEQIRTAKRHLPRGYSRELPHLVSGATANYPRVYDIALEVIAHVDGHVDQENIASFVAAYQQVTPLKIGEFWAIPIMLRLALIENLRRVAVRVMVGMSDRKLAAYWADRLIETAEKKPSDLILAAADLARSTPPLSNSFVAEFARRLQGQGGTMDIPLSWLEHQLTEHGVNVSQTIQIESQQQAANQVSVSASIGSLRFLGAMDWREFVESMSAIDRELGHDPLGVYHTMDFATRDSYRHIVERIARKGNASEIEVARYAVKLAKAPPLNRKASNQDRYHHVGYYLVDEGRPQLEKAFGISTLSTKISHAMRFAIFTGSVLSFSVIATFVVAHLLELNSLNLNLAVLFYLLLLVSTSQLAVAIANWLATTFVKPKLLPRLDFSKEIPAEFRAMIVVPCMLLNRRNINKLVEDLEVRFLANRDKHLHFALLTDFTDAPTETLARDADLIAQAAASVEDLNSKYREKRDDIFFLFHRPRLWNKQEKVWMSFERKRGKLEALNRLLLSKSQATENSQSSFSKIVGNTAALVGVKYVITLDADTDLPRDAAHKLISTMAHPLNRPVYDPMGRVVAGYSILQPRVGVSLPGSTRSWFARLYGGDPGIDPYTRAVSDVYQDLFGEGSFIGKGIYDVEYFYKSLSESLPTNLILSHDLLEGSYARCGLVSDVLLYEDFPDKYCEEAKRRHRWIRGDWQIFFWLLPKTPSLDGSFRKNPISVLSKWKIFDNLRRSILPIVNLLLLVLGWWLLPDKVALVPVVVAIIILPAVLAALSQAMRPPPEASIRPHLRGVCRSMFLQVVQVFLSIVFLPYEAYFHWRAITRTHLQMLTTRRGLLEWQSASTTLQGSDRSSLTYVAATMAFAPLLAVATCLFLIEQSSLAYTTAAPVLLLWLTSPIFAWWISRTLPDRDIKLSENQNEYLRRLARKTWRFFETFVGAEDNWLPPDNYQEYPVGVVAHRTSPTNIGLSLLANLTAYDFGYVSRKALLERTSNTLQTMERLERFRGHFFNWYDTITLKPLPPQYVSTVDSGNLNGMLLTLKTGLKDLANDAVVPQELFGGLVDTLDELISVLDQQGGTKDVRAELAKLRESLKIPPHTFAEHQQLSGAVDTALGKLKVLSSNDSELRWWTESLQKQYTEGLQQPLRMLELFIATKDVPIELRPILDQLGEMPTLSQVATLRQTALPIVDELRFKLQAGGDPSNLEDLRTAIFTASSAASESLLLIDELAQQCDDFAAVDYEFLYERTRHLLAIGYNVHDHRRDASFYDLLASEARLCSFVAIAQGLLPQEHWFALGRSLTESNHEPTLLSWSGSMFEYLMPLLIMPTFKNTLLDQTYKTAVKRQIEYGNQRSVPWGISESGYNTTDANLNYQYRAFGVPGLGFKRGLAEDLVISPYATVLALMVAPKEACANMQRMTQLGFENQYGFYEAVDYTATRLASGLTHTIIKSYMAHHQGMSFLSLANHLFHQKMQKRFLSDPCFQATELLLHERIPKVATFYPHTQDVVGSLSSANEQETVLRVIQTPNTPRPEVHLLSNGRYTVMITNGGGGYSRWNDLALTRWREDPTSDNWGTFCYVRDLTNNKVWSSGYQPTLNYRESYEAIFPQAKAEFRRRVDNLEMHTEITVSPEDDIELRRFNLTNQSAHKRVVELTTYAEVVLATQSADEAHPAFSNLFVQTEIVPEKHAIICSRRARSDAEKIPTMFHLMSVHGQTLGPMSYETDRTKFIGRGRTTATPIMLAQHEPRDLSGMQGSVLDPIVAIRCRVTILPEETVHVHTVTGIGGTRADALRLTEKYHDRHLADRVFDLAWTHRQVVLRQLNISEADANLYSRLASSILYASSLRRAGAAILTKNRRGQSTLWGYGISGDLPIVLLRITGEEKIAIVKQLVEAHGYWNMMGLKVDLVILNEDDSGYRQLLFESVLGIIAASASANKLDKPGGIFIRRAEQMPEEDRILLQTIARVIVIDTGGTLFDQVDRRSRPVAPPAAFVPTKTPDKVVLNVGEGDTLSEEQKSLQNSHGGFSQDGREYVIVTSPSHVTPAPWVNVLANPHFGSIVSESGGSYTWCENAHEFRLTPWNNDALTDQSGEAFYLRDEETGEFWSPTPLPARANSMYVTRHGFGYSNFKNTNAGITTELTTFVSIDAPVKIMILKMRNDSKTDRMLSVTGYCEWVLGELRAKSLLHILSECDPTSNALFARNPYHSEFGGRIAFFDVNEKTRTYTGDRSEFVGRNGNLANPAAMSRKNLSGRTGAALDACAAIQAPVNIAAGKEVEVVFIMGMARDVDDARTLIRRFKSVPAAHNALTKVKQYWEHTLGSVQIKTPDESLNVLTNGWLIYQVLACRVWARSGFYQSGGAFGFRDQLQDTMSLLYSEPLLLRGHLLRCAARQFREGDVQHWWHPPSGRGVRTHFSDDYLWLPYATSHYVLCTGDTGVLNERVPFIEGRHLRSDEEAYGDLPIVSDETATLYEHCVRAIRRGLKFGQHGLPLMGCGDWNDGMNLVGEQGRGESVWLAFFLYDVLQRFSKVAQKRGDTDFETTCLEASATLQKNIEEHGWDGRWYRRAYFDNGEPLGSSKNTECQIDSLPQSWAVLSKAGDPQRAKAAMAIVNERLVDSANSIIKLFDPPFDKTALNPGYIKGYVPGVRENGGQYTHAAIWVAMAFAALGDDKRAWELFDMINPIKHSNSAAKAGVYKVEPYVVAADVYAVTPHTGRGGWTWYTGSAGWMYRLIIETLLGLRLEVDKLYFKPCIPQSWQNFEVRYRYRETFYHIVLNVGGAKTTSKARITYDGNLQDADHLLLVDDQKEHRVEVNFS